METTVSGKQITVTTAFRLPITDYQQAQAMAEAEGVKLSAVMRRLVAVGLEAQQERKARREVMT
jgi:hypothetical protein